MCSLLGVNINQKYCRGLIPRNSRFWYMSTGLRINLDSNPEDYCNSVLQEDTIIFDTEEMFRSGSGKIG